ncbi:GNAT family N-acetyltransferase [bacterium]|nr:GNAT family N-acetyltransferase [bacterium]
MNDVPTPVRIERATANHLAEISQLAGVIWRVCYPGIISPEQIDYMLGWMYAVDEMQRQLEHGTIYERLLIDGHLKGFAAHSPTTDPRERKLDKLYVHPDYQRLGYGSRLLEHVIESARGLGCETLMLAVNKQNARAIAAYRKNGFAIREEVVTDIGGGFVMDDYVMAKVL